MISAEDFVAIHSNTVLQLEMVQNLKMNKRASSWISSRVSFQESPGLAGLFGISVKFFSSAPLSLSRSLSLHCMAPGSSKKTATEGVLLEALVASGFLQRRKLHAKTRWRFKLHHCTTCFYPELAQCFVAHVLHACCICSACVLRPCCMSCCASKRV